MINTSGYFTCLQAVVAQLVERVTVNPLAGNGHHKVNGSSPFDGAPTSSSSLSA